MQKSTFQLKMFLFQTDSFPEKKTKKQKTRPLPCSMDVRGQTAFILCCVLVRAQGRSQAGRIAERVSALSLWLRKAPSAQCTWLLDQVDSVSSVLYRAEVFNSQLQMA